MKNQSSNTALALVMRYGSPVIKLQTAIEDYLPHIGLAQAKVRAAKHELPFPAFKDAKSKKAQYFVNVMDVAAWLDREHERAADEWAKLNR